MQLHCHSHLSEPLGDLYCCVLLYVHTHSCSQHSPFQRRSLSLELTSSRMVGNLTYDLFTWFGNPPGTNSRSLSRTSWDTEDRRKPDLNGNWIPETSSNLEAYTSNLLALIVLWSPRKILATRHWAYKNFHPLWFPLLFPMENYSEV